MFTRASRQKAALIKRGFTEIRPRIFARGTEWYQLASDGGLHRLTASNSSEMRDRQALRTPYPFHNSGV